MACLPTSPDHLQAMQFERISVFHKEGFKLPVPNQCCEMIELDGHIFSIIPQNISACEYYQYVLRAIEVEVQLTAAIYDDVISVSGTGSYMSTSIGPKTAYPYF